VNRNARRRTSICLLLLTLGFGAGARPEEEIRAFTAHSTKRTLSVSAENRWAVQGEAARDGEYRETLELAFTGSVYHPNLLSYSLQTRLGLQQQEDGQSLSHGLVADLHFLADLLKEKPYSLSLYTNHGEDYLDSDLFDTGRVRETDLGGFGYWDNALAPLTLSARKSWRETERDGLQSYEEALVLSGGLARSSPDRSAWTRLDYVYSDFDRRFGGLFAQEGRSHDLRLANRFGFGAGKNSSLSSTLYYLNLAGTLDSETLDLTEALELQHPLGLSSRYYYNLRGSRTPQAQSLSHRGELELQHRLYESLVTTLRGRGQLTAAADYRQAGLAPSLDLAYRKKIRGGYLSLSYDLAASWDRRESSSAQTGVLDETHTLTDGRLELLAYPEVDPGSVVVTDTAGAVTYVPGVDYELLMIGDRTQLRRIFSGVIGNGQEVLVDYLTSSGGSFEQLALSQTAGTRLELFEEALGLYYRYHRNRQPQEETSLDRLDQHLLGISLDLAPVSLGAEYEHYGSALLPYDGLRFQQGLSLPIGGRSLLTVQGAQSFLRLRETGAMQNQLELQAQYGLALGSFATLSAAAGYRRQAETGAPVLFLWTAKAGLGFRRGALSASLDYELRVSDTSGTGNWNHTARLSLAREL
jgi:hypothetical protein